MVALAGCGDGPRAPLATAPDTRLTVSRYDGERLLGTRVLDCAPVAGECARVAGLLPALRPVPDEVCAQIYGGPRRIVVEGRVTGRPVSVEVTRTDGCAIDRYDRLEGALAPG